MNGVAVPKGGWEYMWTTALPNGGVRAAYVETVMESVDFAGLGICGAY